MRRRHEWRPVSEEDDAELAEFQAWLRAQLPVLEALMVIADSEGDVGLLRIATGTPVVSV